EVAWEMRPVQPGDAEYVHADLRAYIEGELLPRMRAVWPEASIETEVIGEVAGLIPTDHNEARRIVSELTRANSADVVSFGTEAGLYQALGTDVVVCGPGSIEQAHKADEYIALDQLSECLTMLERLGDRLARSG
ncbi:MAG: M20/M25/M40 family metallo-hydrolase, partial [Planctomycetes bacterium]|nr:M20/M25/M40 family metallo-hydrolase [Planctomycetota bacterium]